ncbi:L,D-transpeptidase family protein [Hydrogenophaga sp. T2]|uniref:L,D-transpeptidase family protein n=1 Tax=Hydrogenophaga sp. T2 TaxID=3132823 RepID=UPI003CFA7B7A
MPPFAPRWSRRAWLQAAGGLAAWPALGSTQAQAQGPAPAALPTHWPEAPAREALALLAAAGEHGLDPADYGTDALAQRLPAALAAPEGPEAAAFARALNAAMLRLLHDLAFGRIDPRQIHHRFSVAPREGFDPAQALAAALARGRPADAVRAALPPLPFYGQLQGVLAGLRALGDPPAWAQPLPALPRPAGARQPKLEPGAAWPGLPLLAQRLVLLGDLPASAPVPARLEGPLLDALKAFQDRHGLAPDGVIGAGTRAALEVPPAACARQVALTLERLRWTPLFLGPRMIVVNIPEFVLRAYEVVDGRIAVRLQMRVIVGEALDHETPLFDERLRSIEFSPYWNVPPSIARAELVPRLRRDPGHWARQGFEFVTGDGRVETALSPAGLDAVLAGRSRIRQRPGPANALGDIKFVFPNRDNIYLHHTPSVGLFARERRDFSHGCIRVEDPVGLARFVMDGMPGWDEDRIRAQMAAGTSTHVALREPLPVLIAYATALVAQGRPRFLPDVYGLDARLQAALDARPRTPPETAR